MACIDHLDGDPERLWAHLHANQSPYSRITTWVRVTQFWEWGAWCWPLQYNPYEIFREANPRLFDTKSAYIRRIPKQSFKDAWQKLEGARPDVRKRAREILGAGLRWIESVRHENGEVVGKGGRIRKVYVPVVEGKPFEMSYSTFRRELKKLGLKPHDLRKIFAKESVRQGANQFDLCTLMGWSNLNTARSYVEGDEEKIERLVQSFVPKS